MGKLAPLRKGVRLLRRAVQQAAGVNAKYFSAVTGETYNMNGLVVPRENAAEGETNTGLQFTHRVQSFKIQVNDLPVVPQRLDVIKWEQYPDTNPGVYYDYQVLSDGQREVEPLGSFQDTWIIHTKAIADD